MGVSGTQLGQNNFSHRIGGEFHETQRASAGAIGVRDHRPCATFASQFALADKVPFELVCENQTFPAGTCQPSAQTILSAMARYLEKP
jgi:hypothetical protein